MSLGVAALTVFISVGPLSAQDDNPRRRWEYFRAQRAYPSGNIEPRALQTARRQLLLDWPTMDAPTSALVAAPWRPIGPERIPIALTSTGRLSAIAVHPADPATIYIGAAQGGVWKTTDGGAVWAPLTDRQCSLAMGSIAIDPLDPNIVYAGTGEQHFSGDSYYGCGVLRSVDAGVTWTESRDVFEPSTPGAGARISRIVIDPATAGSAATTTLLVASDFGLFRSTNSASSWTLVLDGTATDLVMDPANNMVLYTGRWGSGISKSEDGGVTWAPLGIGLPTTNVGRVVLAIAPSAPLTLYAAIHNSSSQDLEGIYTTTDGGDTWSKLSATNAGCGSQCWYDMAIAVHPADESIVYFGGISLYRSLNAGQSFSSISGGIHVDQHTIAFDSQDPATVYVGNDGGVYRSLDSGTTWSSLNTNLAITQFYPGVALHPTDPDVAIGGTQDNGTVGYAGVADWASLLGGDGGFTAIDPLDPTTRYGETQWSASSGFSGPRRSDNGSSFQLKTNGIVNGDRALFIPPLVMDPVDPRVLYFGTFRLYRTTDRGEQWTVFSPDLTSGGNISAIAISPADPNVIYAGSSSGDVQVSSDLGGVWTDVSAGLPDRYVSDIAVDYADPGAAFVTVSGFGSSHVFATSDTGQTWVDVSSNLPDVPVNTILQEPGSPASLYIGTDLGAWASTDGGANWSPFNDGLPLVAVFDLAIMHNTGVLMAGTHGRGMFSRTINIPVSLSMHPSSRVDTLLEGSTTAVVDSVRVALTGVGSINTAWTASHGGGSWLTIQTLNGVGNDVVRWARDPSGLARGTYVDTITVLAGVPGVAAIVVDTFVVAEALTLAVNGASRADTSVAGLVTPFADSAVVELRGLGAGSAVWSAAHGAGAWMTITAAGGVGSGVVRWNRIAAALAAGVYVDTIVVSADSAVGSPAEIRDTLVVAEPIAIDAAARHLFFGDEVTALQAAFLEANGNDDGVYNLGDVLAWLDHCLSASPAGCISTATLPTRRPVSDPGLPRRR